MIKVDERLLGIFFQHLSVQSILDMKDNYGEVSVGKLIEMNSQATQSIPIKIGHQTMAIMFVYDAKSVWNLVLLTGGHFARNKDKLTGQIKGIIDMLKEREIHSIVYKNAKQITTLFEELGFTPRGEKDKYIILGYKK